MSYLEFDKTQLINLEYSLKRELLGSNRTGCYTYTTIITCNTRKYHGLLVCPMDELDGENHVILSSVDEMIIQHEQRFNLGIHKYAGDCYDPKGHKYIRDFEAVPVPKITYRVGGVVLTKEVLLAENEERILIRYKLVEANSPTTLQFKPFLAFRNVHRLSKANIYANTKYNFVNNGIRTRLYQDYPDLFMQFSKNVEFIPSPDWYYNIEYIEEQRRGYDYKEDLFVPGFFETPIKKGESIIFSAGLKEAGTTNLKRKFDSEINKRAPGNSYINCLKNAARQFIVKKGKKAEIIAGFPWFGRWGRDTFISLPGLTLTIGDFKICKSILDTMAGELEGGLFPNVGKGNSASFNSVDTPL